MSTLEKWKWRVEKIWSEYVLLEEFMSEEEKEEHVEIILRNKHEIVVIPEDKIYSNWENFSSAFLMKDDNGLWELYIPIYITNKRYVNLKNFYKVASNIEYYEVLDSFILYKVVSEKENVYWQCFSLDRYCTVTTIWNSEKYSNLIPARIKEIPKIFEENVFFDMNFSKMCIKQYYNNVCALIVDGETILVINMMTGLDDNKMDLKNIRLPGIIQYFYDKFAVVKCNDDSILYEVYRGSRNERYPKIVKIDQVLKEGLKESETPENGIAILNEEGKITEFMCKFELVRNENECIFPEKNISMKLNIPVDELSFRRIGTSKPKEFVFEINTWNNNQKKSIYDFNGIIFEI